MNRHDKIDENTSHRKPPAFGPADFSRLDESDDSRFYCRDRFVNHLDTTALSAIEDIIGQLVVEDSPAILDLMASWDSHIPDNVHPSRVVGLGMNERELSKNKALTQYVVHDLNKDPCLPFQGASFDVVLNTVSVDYLVKPLEVFSEVCRILRPGGLYLVTFSNRYFNTKAVKIWRDRSDEERLKYVKSLFKAAGGFEKTTVFITKNRPRPEDDRFAKMGVPSDPVYAVYADTTGSKTKRQRPDVRLSDENRVSDDEIKRRKSAVKETLCCPYCLEPLTKWIVPDHPFTQWDNEFMYVCFNNACPYYTRSWETMHKQGNMGMTYRLMYNPEKDRCMAAPVPCPTDVRTSLRG